MSTHPDPDIRAYITRIGGPDAFAAKHGFSRRNAQRIYSGQRPCPNRLRDEIFGPWVDEAQHIPAEGLRSFIEGQGE